MGGAERGLAEGLLLFFPFISLALPLLQGAQSWRMQGYPYFILTAIMTSGNFVPLQGFEPSPKISTPNQFHCLLKQMEKTLGSNTDLKHLWVGMSSVNQKRWVVNVIDGKLGVVEEFGNWQESRQCWGWNTSNRAYLAFI